MPFKCAPRGHVGAGLLPASVPGAAGPPASGRTRALYLGASGPVRGGTARSSPRRPYMSGAL